MENVKKKFNDTYTQNIFPLLNSLEQRRKKVLAQINSVRNLLILLGFLPILLTVFLFIIPSQSAASAFIMIFLTFISLFILTPFIIYISAFIYSFYKRDTVRSFKNEIKKTLIPAVLPCFDGLELKYKDQSFEKGLLIESALFSSFDFGVNCDDAFTGRYKNVWFHIDEIIKSDRYAYRFIVIMFPAPKFIKARTIINGYAPLTYQKVKLEDVEFSKFFDVRSKDQVEARYLLTPVFMEKLKELQSVFGDGSNLNNIRCSFFSGKVMFAIPTNKDVFEFGDLFTPLVDKIRILKFIDELEAICKIIDLFRLYENTGL